jgi:hypothetical protein
MASTFFKASWTAASLCSSASTCKMMDNLNDKKMN